MSDEWELRSGPGFTFFTTREWAKLIEREMEIQRAAFLAILSERLFDKDDDA